MTPYLFSIKQQKNWIQHYQRVRVTVQAMTHRGVKPQEITIGVLAKEAGASVATIYLFALVQRANPNVQRRRAEQMYQGAIEQLQAELKQARDTPVCIRQEKRKSQKGG